MLLSILFHVHDFIAGENREIEGVVVMLVIRPRQKDRKKKVEEVERHRFITRRGYEREAICSHSSDDRTPLGRKMIVLQYDKEERKREQEMNDNRGRSAKQGEEKSS